ncbi:hypothetical protein T07_7525 [Trichinella nelsoni]|uniref:Uncharacterized protein n=1 Tax=Trichinella nelsoni TaxID=6336 RepID=A0A0V0RBQ0_9BILA|nr:hypothetical protein T07_7525 [Trichinella nelsoni]
MRVPLHLCLGSVKELSRSSQCWQMTDLATVAVVVNMAGESVAEAVAILKRRNKECKDLDVRH